MAETCLKCGKNFRGKGGLEWHTARQHPSPGLPPGHPSGGRQANSGGPKEEITIVEALERLGATVSRWEAEMREAKAVLALDGGQEGFDTMPLLAGERGLLLQLAARVVMLEDIQLQMQDEIAALERKTNNDRRTHG